MDERAHASTRGLSGWTSTLSTALPTVSIPGYLRGPVRAAIVNFGCRLNAADGEATAASLRAEGWTLGRVDEAELVIVNGCTITQAADADARAAVRRIRRDRPAARIIATGCWAEADPGAAALPGVDAVVGNADKSRLPSIARGVLGRGRGDVDVHVGRLHRGLPVDPGPIDPDARGRALVKVQDGCDYRCSFCIVPRVRGPSRSLALAAIVARVQALVAAGVREVVLTGIHLGTWGRDLLPRRSLAELVAALVEVLGPARLRLSSIDPHEVDDVLLDAMVAGGDRVCRHLHLPVQSCDDGVLAQMRRAHRSATFVSTVRRALDRLPAIAISSDVIAGFPGEDEAAAGRTRVTLAELPLAYLHVFPFSPRPGTPAADMPDAVPAADIRARAARLRRVSDDHAARFRATLVGQPLDLVAHRRPDRHGVWWARSDHDLRVRLARAPRGAGMRLQAVLADDGVTAVET